MLGRSDSYRFCSIVLLLSIMLTACGKEPNRLTVAFPIDLLRTDRRILDPENTQTVIEYYLLENISEGLVRDSPQSVTGYEPAIARSWERLSPRRWALDLDPGFKWSDGSPVTPKQVAAHLNRISDGRHRHLIYLKKLRNVDISGHRLVLNFGAPVNDGLLHELSLADAFLLHSRNLQGDWSIGAGPYVIDSFSPGKHLLLRRNPLSPRSAQAPESVSLIQIPWKDRPRMFKDQGVDLYRANGPHFSRANQPILSAAPASYRGYPTNIYYLSFTPASPLAKNASQRRRIAAIVKSALSGIRLPGLAPEQQLVPQGFTGTLPPKASPSARPSASPLPKSLAINLWPSFRSVPQMEQALLKKFAAEGTALTVSYEDDEHADIEMHSFIGNQRDSLGSWAFLLSPGQGELRDARRKVEKAIDAATSTDDPRVREALLKEIHMTLISEAFAIPLFVEPNIFLHTPRIDLSRISRFDMRLRFYDVRWR